MTTPWTHETTAVPLLLLSSSALESQWAEIIEWQGSHTVQFYKDAISHAYDLGQLTNQELNDMRKEIGNELINGWT